MRALVPTSDPSTPVEIRDIAEPDPADDDVVVEIRAFSVNRGETFLLEDPSPGWRPGKDVAGTVVRQARSGRGPRVGARVVAHAPSGGWAERVAVPAADVAALPDAIEDRVAAALPLAGLTALRLTRAVGPMASLRVLLTGASGGVGHYLTELAAAQGALVTAVTSSAERGARLVELGAAESVRSVAEADGPFDVGVDSVGGESTPEVLARLTDDGLLVWFGQAGRRPPTLDFFDWRGGANARLRKFHYLSGPHARPGDLTTLVRLVAQDRLHPEIGVTAPWEQTGAVIEQLLARSVRGNAVLTVA